MEKLVRKTYRVKAQIRVSSEMELQTIVICSLAHYRGSEVLEIVSSNMTISEPLRWKLYTMVKDMVKAGLDTASCGDLTIYAVKH